MIKPGLSRDAASESVRARQLRAMRMAIGHLCAAAESLHQHTAPQTPLPRPRNWTIGRQNARAMRLHIADLAILTVEIPAWGDNGILEINPGGNADIGRVAVILCEQLGYKPRLVLRAIRRIEAATAWAQRRVEGRRRQAEHILGAQAGAQEQIDAMAVLDAIGESQHERT